VRRPLKEEDLTLKLIWSASSTSTLSRLSAGHAFASSRSSIKSPSRVADTLVALMFNEGVRMVIAKLSYQIGLVGLWGAQST
jgi:hypothetical protein